MSEEFSIKTIRTGDKIESYISMSAFVGLEQDLARTREQLKEAQSEARWADEYFKKSQKLEQQLLITREALMKIAKDIDYRKWSDVQLELAWINATAEDALAKLNTPMPMGEEG